MRSSEVEIRSMVDIETAAWNARDAETLVSLFHPDTVWPWPPNADAHDPMQWAISTRGESAVASIQLLDHPRIVRRLARRSDYRARRPSNRHAASSTFETDCATPYFPS